VGSEHKADLLVVNGDIVTMNAERQVLVGGAVAIADGLIVDVGATSDLRRVWPGVKELNANGGVVTPGMINAHQHLTGDPLARSCIPDDLVPGASIFEWSVPLHGAHTGDDDELSAALTCVESALNGVTTLIEAGTVAHPDRVARAMTSVGVRGTVGTWGWDVEEGPFAAPADEVLDRQRAVLDAYPTDPTDPTGPSPTSTEHSTLVTGWVTLVGHSLASDALLAGAAELARQRGVGLTMHMSPTRSDPDVYLERTGRRPLEHLDALGVLGRNLLLAHAVWLDDTEVDALLRTQTAVAYCPWAYLRLGQGASRHGRHAEIVRRGGRVALGCDATNAGDQVDILRTAALAAGLAKDAAIDPQAFGAHEAFELATIRGAEAVGMAKEIGSLEPGKRADLVIHDPKAAQWSPRGDVALQLVWSADGRTVKHVLIDGRVVVQDGRCVTVDLESLQAEATEAAGKLFARAGIRVTPRWPHLPAS
jgi:5-methylthioadenosine/S-adenosylhomocysteine deaminase